MAPVNKSKPGCPFLMKKLFLETLFFQPLRLFPVYIFRNIFSIVPPAHDHQGNQKQ